MSDNDWEMRRAADGTVAVRRAGQLSGVLVHTYPADWTEQELADYLAGVATKAEAALVAAEQLAAERLAHIREIEQAVDRDGLWEHTYDGDESGEWADCWGRSYLATLIADYREGTESQVAP